MKFTIFKLHFYFGALDNPLSIVAHANVRRHDGMHEKIEHPIDKWYGIDYNDTWFFGVLKLGRRKQGWTL